MHTTVIGCGRWGTFIAWYLATKAGHDVMLYGRPGSAHMAQLMQEGRNGLLTLPKEVTLSTDSAWAIAQAALVIISVNTQALRGLLTELPALREKTIVFCMKGLEVETGMRLTEIAAQCGCKRTAIWVGPGHVQDFTRGCPNCMVIDSADPALTRELADAFDSELIRFYYGEDLVGNEVGAAAKNVIGIAAGMLDGLSRGSLKGALMARGTREVGRLIAAMGGDERTAYGLSHLGDYEATVFSVHSHNRRFGEDFIRRTRYHSGLAEGVYTAQALMRLSERYRVELPICSTIYQVLYENQPPEEALTALFSRSRKPEFYSF